MSNETKNTSMPEPHPLLAELQQQRAAFLTQLATTCAEIQYIKETVLPEVSAEYDRQFRHLEIDLQRAALRASELGRREELLRTKLARGETLSLKTIELVYAIVDREFERLRRSFREAFLMTQEEREQAATLNAQEGRSNQGQHDKDEQCTRLYRAIAKKIHPDLHHFSSNPTQHSSPHSSTSLNTTATNALDTPADSLLQNTPSAMFARYWHTVREAFEQRNIGKLQTIFDIVCAGDAESMGSMQEMNPQSMPSLSSVEHLQREIIRLEGRLRVEERKLRDLTRSELYCVRELIKSATWCETEREKRKTEIAKKEHDAERSRQFLAEIHAGLGIEWRDTTTQEEQQKQERFHTDFMNATYFKM